MTGVDPGRAACIAELQALRDRYRKAGKPVKADVVRACIVVLQRAARSRKCSAKTLE
ncbi:hypothetical protein [Methylibium petroleiphilum]